MTKLTSAQRAALRQAVFHDGFLFGKEDREYSRTRHGLPKGERAAVARLAELGLVTGEGRHARATEAGLALARQLREEFFARLHPNR